MSWFCRSGNGNGNGDRTQGDPGCLDAETKMIQKQQQQLLQYPEEWLELTLWGGIVAVTTRFEVEAAAAAPKRTAEDWPLKTPTHWLTLDKNHYGDYVSSFRGGGGNDG